jgi:hypothetical protein
MAEVTARLKRTVTSSALALEAEAMRLETSADKPRLQDIIGPRKLPARPL